MPMEVKTMSNGHTRIRISRKDVPVFASLINHFIRSHGGKLLNESSRFVYYEINKNLIYLKEAVK